MKKGVKEGIGKERRKQGCMKGGEEGRMSESQDEMKETILSGGGAKDGSEHGRMDGRGVKDV